MSVWVAQTRPGWPHGDGNGRGGFASREEAEAWIASMREARDTSPVWVEFKAQGIDWRIVDSEEDA
jgi:hypothetical protein